MNIPQLPQAMIQEEKSQVSLPEEWRESKYGQRFNLHAERWALDSRISINVAELRALCSSSEILEGLIRTLGHQAEDMAAGTVKNRCTALKAFLHFAEIDSHKTTISSTVVTNYRSFCLARDGHDFEMGAKIRPFLTQWYNLGYPGISSELIREISDWTLSNPEKGVAVNREDVNDGPLMPSEHVALEAQWLTAFENGALPLRDYVCLRLLSITGRRPIQVASIKLKDLDNSRFEDSKDGELPRRLHLLHIPRAKSRGTGFRARFRSVPLSDDFWNLLMMQRRDVCKKLDALFDSLDISLQPNDLVTFRNEMPLFPMWRAINTCVSELRETITRGQHGYAINALRELVASDAWHGSQQIGLFMERAMATVDATNRDGGQLHVFPRRFRYTVEFNLERQGCPPPVIAWNLDHSNVQSLASYSKNGPDKARSLSKAMALSLKPYVNMFQGQVVDSEADAVGGDDPAYSRILIDETTGGATCSIKRGCGLAAIPRCCYNGCQHFRPWVDGPHERFLESLLEERERDLQILRPVEDRAIIEAADDLILGVVQVIHLCEVRRLELATQHGVPG